MNLTLSCIFLHHSLKSQNLLLTFGSMDLTLMQALFPLVGILMIIAGAAVLMHARRLY